MRKFGSYILILTLSLAVGCSQSKMSAQLSSGLPSFVDSGSWTGDTGLSESQLEEELDGEWVSSCFVLQGIYSAFYQISFSGNSINEIIYVFPFSTDCSDGKYDTITILDHFTIPGAAGTPSDGYQINFNEENDPIISGSYPMSYDDSAPYSIIKIHENLLSIGDSTGTLDGTTTAKRPISWVAFSFIRE